MADCLINGEKTAEVLPVTLAISENLMETHCHSNAPFLTPPITRTCLRPCSFPILLGYMWSVCVAGILGVCLLKVHLFIIWLKSINLDHHSVQCVSILLCRFFQLRVLWPTGAAEFKNSPTKQSYTFFLLVKVVTAAQKEFKEQNHWNNPPNRSILPILILTSVLN